MKKNLFLLLLLFGASVNSQNVNRTGFYHKISSTNFPHLTYTHPDPADPKKQVTEIVDLCGQDIKGVVTMDKGILYFDFWTIPNATALKAANNACIDGTIILKDSKLSFDINRQNLADPTYVYTIPFRARGFGAATIPLRLRFERNEQPMNVSTQLSFALNYNWMFGKTWFTHRSITNYSWGIGPFLGISTADIKKATSQDLTQYTVDRNNPAITTGINILLNRNNLGLIIASGVDIGMGPDSSNWLYQGIPWLGLGVVANIGYF